MRYLTIILLWGTEALAHPPITWDVLPDSHRPATLRDCPGARLTINHDAGIPPLKWRRFCIY